MDPVRNGGKHPFEYQKPTPEQVETMQAVNDLLHQAYDLIVERVPSGRERSVAITKLQEARMWSNAATVLSDQ